MTLTPRLAAAALAMSLCAVLPVAAPAQDRAAYDAAEAALIDAWEALPLSFRTTGFVATEASGYGMYTLRPDARFAVGEPMIVYAEPLGYAWRDNGDGTYAFGFQIDLILRNPAGEILAQQEAFQTSTLTSRYRNREFYMNITLNLNNAPAGDYVLDYRVIDVVTREEAVISLPFTLVAQ
ncbi:MAG: hypothetical protein Kow0013_27620 [Pararhodobacter sp.]